MNREIKTDLNNILSHICCAIDYGYYNDVLMTDFAELSGYVTDEEIEQYILDDNDDDYTEEDYQCWRERITEWRNKFCKAI